jgi:ribosomal protein L23
MAKKVMLKVSNDPVKREEVIEEKTFTPPTRNAVDESFDIRDIMYQLVGSGNALKPDDKMAMYGRLQTLLGADKAQKLMNHAYIFNTRPDVQKLPTEAKITSFFNIGSNDADVNQLIQKTKALGYGVQPGFRTSVSDANQRLAGRLGGDVALNPNEEMQKKVMLKIRK